MIISTPTLALLIRLVQDPDIALHACTKHIRFELSFFKKCFLKPVNQSKQSSTAYIHFCTNFPIMHFPLTSDPKYNFLLYLRVVSNAIERLVILIRMIIENLNYFRLILLFPFVGFEVSQSGNIHQYFHLFRRLIFYYCTRTFRGVIYI